jgi:hypothetical protein
MESIDCSGTCLAILEQGQEKGKRCWRPCSTNGYCGKHQKNALLEKGIKEGKKKCKTFRCIELIENGIYCKECIKHKKEKIKDLPLCVAIIQQGSNKGEKCTKIATEGNYCGKHYERNVLINEAINKNKRICDDGKRACKNETEEGKLRCEECLKKERLYDAKEYQKKQLDPDACLDCGKKMEEKTEGFRSKIVKRCKECYEKLKKMEEKRERVERDYDKERKANIAKHYDEYVRSSIKRNLQMTIDVDDFDKLVNSHCYYCNTYDESKVIGLDRVDSSKHYTLENVVPCCAVCNMMKGNLTKEDFLNRISQIYSNLIEHTLEEVREDSTETEETSYVRPRVIIGYYRKNNLIEYIETCIKDSRSPVFIEKIKKLIDLKLNEKECVSYIKNALQSDSNAVTLTNRQSRERISKTEMYGYLELSKYEKCIELYESAHGKDEEYQKEIKELSKEWPSLSNEQKLKAFNKITVRFQNKRSRKNSPGLVE